MRWVAWSWFWPQWWVGWSCFCCSSLLHRAGEEGLLPDGARRQLQLCRSEMTGERDMLLLMFDSRKALLFSSSPQSQHSKTLGGQVDVTSTGDFRGCWHDHTNARRWKHKHRSASMSVKSNRFQVVAFTRTHACCDSNSEAHTWLASPQSSLKNGQHTAMPSHRPSCT